MSVAAKVKRVFEDPARLSMLGHEVARLQESLDRQMSILDTTPLTVGAYLRGEVKAIDVSRAQTVLASVDAALEGGDHVFRMQSDDHSLSSWAEQLRGTIARAKLYNRGGISKPGE